MIPKTFGTVKNFRKILKKVTLSGLPNLEKVGVSALPMATFKRLETRKLGPLINISMTNEELELPKEMKTVDTEIHFNKFFNLQNLRIKVDIRFARDFFEVDKVKNQEVYRVLIEEYNLIKRYGHLPRQL